MTRFAYCIQCLDPQTGKTGDYLFSRDPSYPGGPRIRHSPLFDNVGQLYVWMRDNGFKAHHDANDPFAVTVA